MVKSEKLTRQIAGTMAIEGMQLNKKELSLVRQCASGQKSSSGIIKELVKKHTVKDII